MTEQIICLGKRFSCEEERREYFRNELRKKLPELKNVDGFPIGEDEDIIALSDPPYFTVCPNPWLNEFINDWENEKNSFEADGLREKTFEVNEPYSVDISEGKNNPIYTAHTYHTKVPHPAIMRYILHYSQPGDIILDAFAGTGMTGVAAQICEKPDLELKTKIESDWSELFGCKPIWGLRKAICGDLSPYASVISYNYNSPTDIDVFEREAENLLNEVKRESSWLYETKHIDKGIGLINYTVWSDVYSCKNCSNEIIFWDAALDSEHKTIKEEFLCPKCGTLNSKNLSDKAWITQFDTCLNKSIRIAKSVPVLIVYTYRGKRYQKRPDIDDITLINGIIESQIPYWCPVYELPQGFNTDQPKKSHGVNNVHLFYTKRNLWALSILHNKIKTSPIPNKLLFILTGMINRSTQMNRIHLNNYFFGGGGWNAGHLKGTLYISSLPIETSILEQISDKISSFKKAISKLKTSYSNIQFVNSATSIMLNDNSIDYIFTDPPFGANIMYSELNFLPEGWLKVLTNNKKEALENTVQGKSILEYQTLMAQCFTEYFRVLKPGKWMTVEFSNTSAAIWNGIQTAIQKAGFVIANISAIDKKQGGIRSITTPTAVRQDLAISCYKPSKMDISTSGCVEEKDVWDFVKEHLNHLPIHLKVKKNTTVIAERNPKILYDRLISFYIMKGLIVPIDAKEFHEGLRQRFIERDGMVFTHDQVIEYDDKKSKTINVVQLSWQIGSETEGIEWLKRELMQMALKYQDIQPKWMQAITAIRKGDILPELRDILQQNFIEEPNGSWRVPDMNEAKDREIIRNKALLKEFNSYFEFATNPKSKRMKEVRVEALRAGFKQCWDTKDFQTIVKISDKIPQNLLLEDERLLMYYDIAKDRV